MKGDVPMSKQKNQKPQAAVYLRVATEEQLMSDEDRKYMKEWTEICQAYCDKVGAELLFVNQADFGCEMPNGELRHIDAQELAVILTNEQPFTSEQDDDGQGITIHTS